MESRSTVRSRLLLIDTCVVIDAHRLNVWNALVDQCHVVLPETVVDECIQVARDFDDVELHLDEQIQKGLIDSPSLDAGPLRIVSQTCPVFPGEIDAGEHECLACLLLDPQGTFVVCTSDGAVFRYLGWTQRQEQGISLEEALKGIGIKKPLPWKHTEKFRRRWTKKGFEEALGQGFIRL